MPAPKRPTTPTSIPDLLWLQTDDGSRTLWNSNLDETFHSGCGAVDESWTVYLGNSGVLDRLRTQLATRVLEVGLGTATSMLLTAAMAEACGTELHYAALERELLPPEVFANLGIVASVQAALQSGEWSAEMPLNFLQHLERLYGNWIEALNALNLDPQSQPKRDSPAWPVQIRLSDFAYLELWLGDARNSIAAMLQHADIQPFDVIYFDPFSPQTNPELWTEPFLGQTYDCLTPGGNLTSYCVKGSVRRILQKLGFQVTKPKGPARGKREVLLASKPGSPATSKR